MRIIAISGDGIGAGKTYLANKLTDTRLSMAGALRQELHLKYPGYDWDNTSQTYKDATTVHEAEGKTVRQVMVEYGQGKCVDDLGYWAKRLVSTINDRYFGNAVIAIDDVRKVAEIEELREAFGDQVVHIHVINLNAKFEPQFQNDSLKELADYVIRRK